MLVPPRLTALIAAALLALAPAAASAQTQVAPPTDAPSLSETPQGPDAEAPEAEEPAPAPSDAEEADDAAGGRPAAELPNTGAETGELALAGGILLLLGVGLRLRTADVRP